MSREERWEKQDYDVTLSMSGISPSLAWARLAGHLGWPGGGQESFSSLANRGKTILMLYKLSLHTSHHNTKHCRRHYLYFYPRQMISSKCKQFIFWILREKYLVFTKLFLILYPKTDHFVFDTTLHVCAIILLYSYILGIMTSSWHFLIMKHFWLLVT